MPNPTNTFLWRYLAQQDAQKAQQGEEARYMADQAGRLQDRELATRKQQFAEDEARGEVLAQLQGSEHVEGMLPSQEVASPSTMRGFDRGRVKKKLEAEAFRQALGLKQLLVDADMKGKIFTAQEAAARAEAGRASRESEGVLNRGQSDANNRRIAGAMGARAAAGQNARVDSGAERLAKALESFPAMRADLEQLRKAVAAPDAPAGVGPIVGRIPTEALGAVGQVEAVSNRMAAQRLLNALIYATTGKALNESEMARALEARGLDGKSPVKFKQGLQTLDAELRVVMAQKEAGFSPEVNEEYSQRPGAVTSENFAYGNEEEEPEPDLHE